MPNHLTTVILAYANFIRKLTEIKYKFVEANFNMTDHDSYVCVEVSDWLNWKIAGADIPIA